MTLTQRIVRRVRTVTANLLELKARVDGQGLAEYALILALIAIVSIVALLFLGSQVSDKFSVIGSTINSVAAGG